MSILISAGTKTVCTLCRGSDLAALIPSDVLPDRAGVLKCRVCELVFLEPRALEGELDPEETVYWDDEEQKRIYLAEKVSRTFRREFEGRLISLSRFVRRSGKILDVGCGVGHFLSVARDFGWEVEGLDISEAASRAAREAYNLEVHIGTLKEIALPRGNYDVLSLWDVIEHIRRPVENLRAANSLLRPKGVLVMKTPDENSFFKQAVLFLYRLFGSKAAFLLKYVYYVPHYFSYSRKSMTNLLGLCGFEVLRFEKDETPQEFASEKIRVHYRKDPKRFWVIRLLPPARFLARILGRGNKMIVYARKVREIEM